MFYQAISKEIPKSDLSFFQKLKIDVIYYILVNLKNIKIVQRYIRFNKLNLEFKKRILIEIITYS